MIDSHPKKESRRKTSKNPKTWYLNTSIKKKKSSQHSPRFPLNFEKKKDCRGDCCQSKVIPDKGYTTRSITSKKIAITLLSIDRGSIDTKPVDRLSGRWWADILWTVSSSSGVKPADYRPSIRLHRWSIIRFEGERQPRQWTIALRPWTEKSMDPRNDAPSNPLESISRWEDKGWRRRRRGIVGKGIDLGETRDPFSRLLRRRVRK